LIYSIEPEFTDAADKLVPGTVSLVIVVEADGRVHDPRIVKASAWDSMKKLWKR